MKKLLLILSLLISTDVFALTAEENIWGNGLKTTQATTTSTIVTDEAGNRAIHKTVITLTNTPIILTSDGSVSVYGGIGTGSQTALYTFPKGAIQILGADVRGTFTGSVTGTLTNNFTGVTALGTTLATAGATLTGTTANILPSSAYTASTQAATVKSYTLATLQPYDGTTTAMPLFMNFSVAWVTTDTSGTAKFTGTVTVTWTNLTNN